jgi:hypothetical protein
MPFTDQLRRLWQPGCGELPTQPHSGRDGRVTRERELTESDAINRPLRNSHAGTAGNCYAACSESRPDCGRRACTRSRLSRADGHGNCSEQYPGP